MAVFKNLYVIVGKSGSGKTTMVEEFHKRYGTIQAESYTDRLQRWEGEKGHEFLSKEEFDKLEGKLLLTEFADYRYTMTKAKLNNCDFAVLDPSGASEIREQYKNRDVVVIGLYCRGDILEERMRERGDSEELINRRIEHDAVVFANMANVCNYIMNSEGTLEENFTQLDNLIMSYETKN